MRFKPLTYTALGKLVFVSGAVLLASLLIAMLVGSNPLDLAAAFQRNGLDRQVILSLRLPRALMATLAGGALAVAGVLFQALLRNPLAEPYTLGVSGGASLGAVAAISFGWETAIGFPAVTAAAFVGALLILLTIWQVASRWGISSNSLLLAGIAMNSICGAFILFLSSIATFLQSFAITRWLVGRLDSPSYSTLIQLTCIVLPVTLVTWRLGTYWNLLSVGEDWASSRGVAVNTFLVLGCVIGSVAAAAVTAYTGPIGFVGLIVPHALRMKLGADHRVLVPCSFLIGGAFLVLSDVVSRVVLRPAEIPVGVVTALIGGPIFIFMLYSGHARQRT